MIHRSHLRFPIALLTILAILTTWLQWKVQWTDLRRDGDQRHDPDYIIENFTATRLNAAGKPRSIMRAKKMTHYPDDDSTILEDITLTQYHDDGAPVTIRALHGNLSANGAEAHFIGKVTMDRDAYRDNAALHLETTELFLLADLDYGKTDQPVRLRRGSTTMEAVGLEFDNANRTFNLKAKVKARYERKKKR